MITLSKFRRFLQTSGARAPLRFRQYLNDTDASYWGVYQSFDEAERDAVRKTGYDDAKMARMHVNHLHRIQPSDYAVMFHLSRVLSQCRKVFDLGGNIGLQFYAFQRQFTFSPDLKWIVCDLPAIIAVGEQIRSERGDSRLSFTSDFSQCEGSDVLLCGASLQYIEEPLWDRLSRLKQRPHYIIINRTPFTSRQRFVTMQNLGPVLSPNLFYNEEEFIHELAELGYMRRDSWITLERGFNIHSHPEYSQSTKKGMVLALQS